MSMERSHHCGDLRKADAGKTVTLCGWVSKRRDHGGIIFIDLRDRHGLVQVVIDPAHDEKDFHKAEGVRSEYVLQVRGLVRERSAETVNPHLPTGEVEVVVKDLNVLNPSKTPPFYIQDGIDVDENVRLRYRYLDLRRPEMQQNLILRHQVTKAIRDFLDKQDFLEIETPDLIRSTPEGARDYLVPSRVNPGKFYALPQSPQLFKQLLMIAGMERYFQIARCFRDEDLRADRQPEFTQIDIEMSFVDEDDVFGVVEHLMHNIFHDVKGVELEDHFIRIPWRECMKRFGSDKPDLRFGNEIQDLTDLFSDSSFTVFKNTANDPRGMIGALKFEHAADKYSRKGLDELQEFVKHGFEAHALAYLKVGSDGTLSGSIAKPLSDEEKAAVSRRLDLHADDLVLVIADKERVTETALGALRVRLGHELNLIPKDAGYKFLWVTEFPMFEWSEEDQRWVAAHHPFTAPKAEDVDKLFSDPEHVSSRAYDLVLNGYELLSGSIRIHDQDLQEKVFEAIGLTMEQAKEKFGFFLEAFKYGAPPHGGVGIGLERLTMVLAGTDNIRDVVAFPTTNSSLSLMDEAPNTVDPKQLQILGIEISKKDKQ